MMIGATVSARVTRNRWPSSMMCSSEFGMRQASMRMLISGMIGSSSPASLHRIKQPTLVLAGDVFVDLPGPGRRRDLPR